jgi:hypothetical protein
VVSKELMPLITAMAVGERKGSAWFYGVAYQADGAGCGGGLYICSYLKGEQAIIALIIFLLICLSGDYIVRYPLGCGKNKAAWDRDGGMK